MRDCGAIENDGTLTEERVEEIIDNASVVRNVHIIPRTRDSFPVDVELNIQTYVIILVSRY